MKFLESSRHLARVWLSLVRASLVRDLAFRTNFFSGLFRQALWLAAFVLYIDVIFQNTQTLAGWHKAEVLIVLALSRFLEGTIDTLFGRNIVSFPEAVTDGRMDIYLTKPLPAQFYMAFRRFSYAGLGNVVAGLILLGYAVAIGNIGFGSHWLVFVLLAFLGLVMYYSLLVFVVSFAFFAERFDAFFAIAHLFSEPLTVPFDVFPRGTRLMLTYLIPLAFVVFVPAQSLTGRLTWWQVPAAVLIVVIFLTLANLMWRAGLRRYSSASS